MRQTVSRTVLRTAFRTAPAVALLAAGLAWTAPRIAGQAGTTTATGQPSTSNGEWPHYTADLSGSKYSPLDQINASNFSKLEVAWRFKTDNLGTASRVQARRHAAHGQGRASTPPRHAPGGRGARRARPAS